MPLKVTLRRAALDDLPAITAIYNDAILNTTATFDTKAKTPEEMRPWFEKHGDRHPFLVAVDESLVAIGWAALHPWSERGAYSETAELSIYIHPEHRGRRVGYQLLAALIVASRAADIHTVIARIADGNAASIRLHEALGFRMIGTMREVGRKFGRLIDVHLMQLMA